MVEHLWQFLLPGYLVTITIETCVLFFALSPPHRTRDRFIAGAWLTACTYPIVVLVLPNMFEDYSASYGWYLLVAETFAPLAECCLFAAVYQTAEMKRSERVRDYAAIVSANLASFLIGHAYNVWAVSS
ncbi:MAG: hypothetical protein ACI9G1_004500 [Pirellulaceae bacterium]|jgi:hypothetical protein